MTALYFVLGILVLAILVIISQRDKSSSTRSTDLLFGYFGTFKDQVAEVKDHTNLVWVTFWEGLEKGIADIRAAQKFTVLDMDKFIFVRPEKNRLVMVADPYTPLRDLFNRLREEGVLHLVKMIVPCDEPNLPENQAEKYLPAAVKAIRTVAAEYSELEGLMLGVIYYPRRAFAHMDLFDVVSYDDYDRGANILAPDGDYERFRASLQPDQKTMLIVGGSYGQPPDHFIEYGQKHPEVLAVVGFVYWYPEHGEDIKGIRDLPVKDAYIAAGRRLLESA